MNTLIIETRNEDELRQFVTLAKRLNVKFYEGASASENLTGEAAIADEEFSALFGSWSGKPADEIISIIEASRITKEIDTSWAE